MVYEYEINYITWQLLNVYIQYWEVCTDKCTGEETKTFIKEVPTGDTQEVIYKTESVKAQL
jgi:hypothetical protein